MGGRSTIIVLMVAFVVLVGLQGRIAAQEEVMLLEHGEVFGSLQRPAVKFTHESHAAIYSDCVECHHVYEYKAGERSNVWAGEDQQCSECHKRNDDGRIKGLRTAFHENCSGCHRELIRKGEKSGPIMCGECHVRER